MNCDFTPPTDFDVESLMRLAEETDQLIAEYRHPKSSASPFDLLAAVAKANAADDWWNNLETCNDAHH